LALPGVTTVLRDNYYVLSRTVIPSGPRCLAIAPRTTATNTPDTNGNAVADLDPYRVISEGDAIAAFGAGSGAHRAYLELAAGGAQIIYIVALPSTTTDSTLASTSAGNVLDAAFDAAETVQPDIIVPWGRGGHSTEWEVPATPGDEPQFFFHADNVASSNSYLRRVADHCMDITDRSHPVFAVMGVHPFVNTANPGPDLTAAQQATYLGTFAGLWSRNDPSWNNGAYVIVTASEIRPLAYTNSERNAELPTGYFGFSNGAGMLAGTLAQLPEESAATGKVVFNVDNNGLRYNPTRTQQQNLINFGLMPVAKDFNRIPRWVDSATYARDGSDYRRMTTLRISYAAILSVRDVSQSFIGEALSLQHRNAFETAISSRLRNMQTAGVLLSSDFRTSYDLTTNSADVELILQPAAELRTINLTVSIQL
jgi:hypothetical protein